MADRHRDPDDDRALDPRTGTAAAEARIKNQGTWVDLQVQQAMARGDFDDLPGYGRPIAGLSEEHDPDWWLKKLIERERITGVLPPSLQIRREDAELDARLDRLGSEREVRRAVAEFNERVRWALYRPAEGPPMITQQRDPESELARWRERLEARRAAHREEAARGAREAAGPRRPTVWWRRRRSRP